MRNTDLNVFESGRESTACCSGLWYNVSGLGTSSKTAYRWFGNGYARIVRNARIQISRNVNRENVQGSRSFRVVGKQSTAWANRPHCAHTHTPGLRVTSNNTLANKYPSNNYQLHASQSCTIHSGRYMFTEFAYLQRTREHRVTSEILIRCIFLLHHQLLSWGT